MKTPTRLATALVGALALGACELRERPLVRNTEAAGRHISYIQDTRNGANLCFALSHSSGATETNIDLAHVPCKNVANQLSAPSDVIPDVLGDPKFQGVIDHIFYERRLDVDLCSAYIADSNGIDHTTVPCEAVDRIESK